MRARRHAPPCTHRPARTAYLGTSRTTCAAARVPRSCPLGAPRSPPISRCGSRPRRPQHAAGHQQARLHFRVGSLRRGARGIGCHVWQLQGARRGALAAADGLEQHRPHQLHVRPAVRPTSHRLWRLLHPRPPVHHRHDLVWREVLLARRRAGTRHARSLAPVPLAAARPLPTAAIDLPQPISSTKRHSICRVWAPLPFGRLALLGASPC